MKKIVQSRVDLIKDEIQLRVESIKHDLDIMMDKFIFDLEEMKINIFKYYHFLDNLVSCSNTNILSSLDAS
jgi:hypothetical protein